MQANRWIGTWVWTHVAAWAVLAASAAGQDAPLVLDQSAYCTSHYQYGWEKISARALKADGARLLGERELKRLESDVKRRLADRTIDWSKTDWRDVAVFRGFRMSGTSDIAKCRAATTDPPPAGWALPDFDDRDWGRFRLPFAVGKSSGVHFGQWRLQGPGLQAAFYRYRFTVADPVRAALTVEVAYYGGVRLFVNGKEVARGHLPTGAIGRESWADDYPLGAYRRLWTELGEKEKARAKRKGRIKDTPPKYFGEVGHRVTPGGRVYKLRRRAVGPVKVPANLLRKGANVLAVEVRAAPLHPAAANGNWLGIRAEHSSAWLHARLIGLALRGSGSAPALKRPPGVQVWSEDAHRRVFSPEFLEPGADRRAIRVVGGPNGTYAAQIVVGTERRLDDVKVVPGDLACEDAAATIPGGAIKVFGMVGHPIGEMVNTLGQGRIPVFRCAVTGREPPPVRQALLRFAPEGAADPKARVRAVKTILYFDQITSAPGEEVPAGSCRPYWLRLKIPPGARPGTYRGSIRVEAPGTAAVTLPMTVEVVAWRVPDPRRFQFNLGIEQSPYAVARRYQVPLWSDEHFALIAASLRQLARVGNDWWFVPVLAQTEFGNGDDSMIRWVRRTDGRIGFDYSVLDRYLDLIVRHAGRPKVVSFVVMHGTSTSPIEVAVLDAATGRSRRLVLGGASADANVRRTYWAAFANDLYRHMAERGLADAMHWGHAWDTEGDPKLKALLRGVVPQVRWTSGSHNTKRGGSGGGGRLDTHYYRSTSEIYSFRLGPVSRKGWRDPESRLNTPRAESTAACVEGHSCPFMWRLAADRALVAGFNGLGRVGGDYWADTYWRGMRGSEWHMAGFPVLTVLWPGARGAETGARLESLIEGVQEAEIRIFVEQAIDRGLLPGDLVRRAEAVLFDHNRQTLSLPTHVPANWMGEGAQNWFARSQRLYRLAADVARAIGLDVGRRELRARVTPYGRPEVTICLRNWTGRPRTWTASASENWLTPVKTEGSAVGFEDLPIRIDARALEPGKTFTGTVTVTDTASGTTHPVTITAEVGKVFDFPGKVVLNVAPGQRCQQDGLALFNSSAAELAWRMASPLAWVKAVPASGRLGAGKIAFVSLVTDAPDKPGTKHADLTVTVGRARATSKLTIHVIPPYRRPAEPAGQNVWLLDAVRSKAVAVKSHVVAGWTSKTQPRDWGFWWVGAPLYNGHNIPGGPREHMVQNRDRDIVPFPMGGRMMRRGYWAFPYAETTYTIAGSGFAAFSTLVGFNRGMEQGVRANRAVVINCEIRVDGQLRVQSGLMKVGDKPRLLVVDGLAGAQTLTLVTRTDRDENELRAVITWAEPKFHKPK